MNEILLITGMAAVTYGIRYPTMALVRRMDLPLWALRALKYVPVAVLSAIVFPAVFIRNGSFALRADNAYLIGAIVAIVVAWRTRNLLWTIITGMIAFLLWGALVG